MTSSPCLSPRGTTVQIPSSSVCSSRLYKQACSFQRCISSQGHSWKHFLGKLRAVIGTSFFSNWLIPALPCGYELNFKLAPAVFFCSSLSGGKIRLSLSLNLLFVCFNENWSFQSTFSTAPALLSSMKLVSMKKVQVAGCEAQLEQGSWWQAQ